MKKKLTTFLLTFAMVFALSSIAFAADSPTVFVNGTTPKFDTPPVVQNGTTLVPMRAIFEALGTTVDFDSATNTITGTKGDTKITLQLNSTTATKNSETVTLDVPAKTVNDRTMVPLRFIGESLDQTVEWIADSQTVNIYTPQVLLDNQDVKITYNGITEDYLGKNMKVFIENKSSRDLCIQVRNFAVNDYMINTIFSPTITVGNKANKEITLTKSSLAESNINEINKIQFNFEIIDANDFLNSYSSDQINMEF